MKNDGFIYSERATVEPGAKVQGVCPLTGAMVDIGKAAAAENAGCRVQLISDKTQPKAKP